MIVETTGGLAPHSRAHLGYLSGRAKAKGAVDRTRYGVSRLSTHSYFLHHTQMISKAAWLYDTRAIIRKVKALKQTYLRVGLATAVAEAFGGA